MPTYKVQRVIRDIERKGCVRIKNNHGSHQKFIGNGVGGKIRNGNNFGGFNGGVSRLQRRDGETCAGGA